MANPKVKLSRSRVRRRRNNVEKLVEYGTRSRCPECGATKLPHRACPVCGYYKGRRYFDVEEEEPEEE